MPNTQVITDDHYQLWLNLVSGRLELHGVNCVHGLKKLFRQYQQFGQPTLLTDQADFDAMSARALKLGEKYAPTPQSCARQFYKGAS